MPDPESAHLVQCTGHSILVPLLSLRFSDAQWGPALVRENMCGIRALLLKPSTQPHLLAGVGALELEVTGALGHAEDADRVGAATLCPPALQSDDDIALLDDAEVERLGEAVLDAVVNVLLPLGVVLGAGVGVEEGVAAAVQVHVAGSVRVAGDGEDRAAGAVLADQTSGVTAGRHEQDGTSVLLERGGDGGHGDGLVGVGGDGGERAHLVEEGHVRDALLGEVCSLGHHLDGLDGVCALGGLSGKHDAVRTVQNGVGDVRNLGTRGAVVDDHRLEHLRGADDGLAGDVALGDHHLLGHEHLGSGDLDTKVTTSNHDTIRLLEDLVKVLHTLVVLDLGDDLDVRALLAEDLADGADIAAAADERGEDHVEVLLDGELNVLPVLVRDGGQVDLGHGKVDTLLGGEDAVVDGAHLDELVALDGEHLEREDTVVDEDGSADLDLVGEVLVVDVEADCGSVKVNGRDLRQFVLNGVRTLTGEREEDAWKGEGGGEKERVGRQVAERIERRRGGCCKQSCANQRDQDRPSELAAAEDEASAPASASHLSAALTRLQIARSAGKLAFGRRVQHRFLSHTAASSSLAHLCRTLSRAEQKKKSSSHSRSLARRRSAAGRENLEMQKKQLAGLLTARPKKKKKKKKKKKEPRLALRKDWAVLPIRPSSIIDEAPSARISCTAFALRASRLLLRHCASA
ncbi:hypothetical protein L1887_58469 [Cichorium endivia]|nr:hypothetical protein L1887_58469 [Cichorium endivia]